jgi:AcrR family transcriptional regulator
MAGPKSRRTRAATEYDSKAKTRAVPAVDELATTREGHPVPATTVLDAAEALIVERGFARTSVEDIAARAGVSVDVFHAHFAGKGAVLRALNDRFVEQMIATVDAATRSGSWRNSRARDVVDIAVRSILEIVDERRGLVRAFLAHGATDRALALGLRRVGAHMTARLMDVIAGCADAGQSPASERAVGFSLLLGVALAHHCILVGEDWAGVGLTREEVAEELGAAIRAYLLARRPS